MSVTKTTIFVILFFAQFLAAAQNKKVVGYLPTYSFGSYNSIAFCKITHLNICFANPDINGNLQIDNFATVMEAAKKQNPNIIISVSLGGGYLTALQMQTWTNFMDIPANRPAFISKIIGFVELNNLNGVDFDIEWDAVTKGYSDFVVELKDSLQKHNKLFTAALPGTYRYPLITSKALAVFDFINIMAYDKTGPWAPNNPGQHSSYDFAVESVNYWKKQGVTAERLTLGVPFYGYNFDDKNNVFGFSYSTMVNTNILYADVDKVGEAYYNGRPTIERKTELSSLKTGGIMIWELGQDRFDEYALLSAIHNKFTSLGISTTLLCGNTVSSEKIAANDLKIYPNPANQILYIEKDLSRKINVLIYNLLGEKMNLKTNDQHNKIELNVTELNDGIYILKLENKGSIQYRKLIIRH